MEIINRDLNGTVSPTEEDTEIAKLSSQKLAAHLKDAGASLELTVDEETVSVPRSAFKLLVNILSNMARGNAITLIPVHAELTTQEAADQLAVSRPFLVKLLEEKKIPFHKVGTHRRIYFQDIVAYKQQADAARQAVLKELQKDAQDNDMGY